MARAAKINPETVRDLFLTVKKADTIKLESMMNRKSEKTGAVKIICLVLGMGEVCGLCGVFEVT